MGYVIQLLGRFSFSCYEYTLLWPEEEDVKRLLGYLALRHSRRHTHEQLASLLWGQLDADRACERLTRVLEQAATLLNSCDDSLPHPLLIDADSVQLVRSSAVFIDAAEFEHLCEQAVQVATLDTDQSVQFYRQALHLYRGDLLISWSEKWCLVERTRFQSLYCEAIHSLVQYYRQRNQATIISV